METIFNKFDSLPTTVDAVQLTHENFNQIIKEIQQEGGVVQLNRDINRPIALTFYTVHGMKVSASIGDWIIKDMKRGTYYPILDNIFKNKYIPRK